MAPTRNGRSISFIGVLSSGVFIAFDLPRLLTREGEEIVLRGVEAAHVHGERRPSLSSALAVDVP